MAMTLEEYQPPLGIRAIWRNGDRFTDWEMILLGALDALVRHDRAADWREGLPGCVELQHAERVLRAMAGSDLWPGDGNVE